VDVQAAREGPHAMIGFYLPPVHQWCEIARTAGQLRAQAEIVAQWTRGMPQPLKPAEVLDVRDGDAPRFLTFEGRTL
jgi:hypothetical protein